MAKVVVYDSSFIWFARDAILQAGIPLIDIFATTDPDEARKNIITDETKLLTTDYAFNDKARELRLEVSQIGNIAIAIITMAEVSDEIREFFLEQKISVFRKDRILGSRNYQQEEFRRFVRSSLGIEG